METNKTNQVEYNGELVTIMLTSNCNIKCKHCYIKFKGSFSIKLLENVLDNLIGKYKIKFNGAENLTNLDYLRYYSVIDQPYVMTNGLLIRDNSQIINILKENNIKTVVMSYHYGTQSDYSVVKTADIDKNIEKLLDAGIEVRLMCTLNSTNYMMVSEICKNFYEKGVRAVKFTNHMIQGNATKMDKEYALNDSMITSVLIEIDQMRNGYSKDEFLIERCGSFGNVLNSSKFYCYGAENSIILVPSLNVYPCIFLIDNGYEIGKYIDNKIILDKAFDGYSNDCVAKKLCNKNSC